MTAYYNEFDPYAAEWLRNLIREGLIAPGDVDERSIHDVQPADLRGYTQCHFFAGIGGWSLALRLAGWSDERPAWSGSCPCQPFSSAGRQGGTADERHLWPELRRLVQECRPPVVLGEQVASRAGRGWLTGVRTDLEALGYAVGAIDLCAASVGAPHIRQRLWWVADADEQRSGIDAEALHARESESGGRRGGMAYGGGAGRGSSRGAGCGSSAGEVCIGAQEPGRRGGARGVGNASCERLAERGSDGRFQREALGAQPREAALGASDAGRVAHGDGLRLESTSKSRNGSEERYAEPRSGLGWSNAIWIPCADGKARRIEPGLEPLAHGIPNRVGRLRAYGNAIVPEVAEAFIRAFDGA